jgi:hypothetical protein
LVRGLVTSRPLWTPRTLPLDAKSAAAWTETFWEKEIVPTISQYIAIPNKSPYYDPKWVENGHMERAVGLISEWAKAHAPPGTKLEVQRLKNEKGTPRTPLIFMEIRHRSEARTPSSSTATSTSSPR